MRHLAPVTLAQLATAPSPPPAGHVSLYPGQDGALRAQESTGDIALLGTTRRTVMTADQELTAALPDWAAITGLQVAVPAGVHRLRTVVDFISRSGDTHYTNVSLDGPAGGRSLKADIYGVLGDDGATFINDYWYLPPWGVFLLGGRAPGLRKLIIDALLYLPTAGAMTVLGNVEPPEGETTTGDFTVKAGSFVQVMPS
ncbi:hypothetical protein [Nonomuraea sp. NPDC005650]|uniref:hypothetical protein n=1 Tax=Nonomuraea sp. NPDC005650 TaxID=3157045 RepID=UPI0033B43E61